MSRLKYKAVFVGLVLALSACASAPPYRAADRADGAGYSEQVIEANRYRVRYTGTAGMTMDEVQNYTLMRAAELSLEKGYDWFEVVARDSTTEKETERGLETDFGRDYEVTRSCGLLGCTQRATPVITRTESSIETTRTIYEHVLEVVMGKGEPLVGSPQVYDAADTLSSLRG